MSVIGITRNYSPKKNYSFHSMLKFRYKYIHFTADKSHSIKKIKLKVVN